MVEILVVGVGGQLGLNGLDDCCIHSYFILEHGQTWLAVDELLG